MTLHACAYTGMKGGEKLGITSILRPKDMSEPTVDHLGVMAYTAAFQWLPKRAPPGQRLTVSWESERDKYRKGVPVCQRNRKFQSFNNLAVISLH